MTELEILQKKIDKLRLKMVEVHEGKSLTDPEVVAVSQELDTALNEYHEMIKSNQNNLFTAYGKNQ